MRRVLDSLGTEKFRKSWASKDRPNVAHIAGAYDDYERVYPWLWVAARHGLAKSEMLTVRWSGVKIDAKPYRLRLEDETLIPLDEADAQDLRRLKLRLPYDGEPPYANKVFSGIDVGKIDTRVMDRWADRAELYRLVPRYADLMLGFAAIDASKFVRFASCIQ